MQGVIKMPSGEDIPVQFIQMIPYVLTIIVLAGFIGLRGTEGARIPYRKGLVRHDDLRKCRLKRPNLLSRNTCKLAVRTASFSAAAWRVCRQLENAVGAPVLNEIPHSRTFRVRRVEGHAGQLVLGEIERHSGRRAAGTVPLYEGYEWNRYVPGAGVWADGRQELILTNAAGSLNTDMPPGSLMLIYGPF